MINEDINESELLMLYREEDEEIKNLVYLKYKPIIDILINKYRSYLKKLKIDFQEVYSECAVGFSDALRNFQEEKDSSLKTFITLCVERRILGLIRKYNRGKYKNLKDMYSLDFSIDDDGSVLLDLISDDGELDPLKNITSNEEYNELLARIKNKFTEKEFEVFSLMYEGFDYLAIAKILEKSPKQIDNTIQRIKVKLKEIIKNVD